MIYFKNVIFIYSLACLFLIVNCLQMELFPGESRCIGQELDQLENVVFAVSASNMPSSSIMKKNVNSKQTLNLFITDPEDNAIFEEKISIGAKLKELDYPITKRGVHEMCFDLNAEHNSPIRIFFHVDYKPLSADGKTLARKVGKDDITGLEKKLEQMNVRLTEISTEIEHARKQEIAMKKAGESTSSSVQWFSILSIMILLATSCWQIIYLRKFFTSKKLL